MKRHVLRSKLCSAALPKGLGLAAGLCFTIGPLWAQGTWTTVAPMVTGRDSQGFVTGPDNRIYAIGGVVTTPPPFVGTTSVEAYDTSTNTWTAVAPMPTPRYAFGAVTVGGLIYAIGGYNEGSVNNNEAYNPNTNIWTELAPMPTPRNGHSVVAARNGKIYTIGGDLTGADLTWERSKFMTRRLTPGLAQLRCPPLV